MNLEMWLGPTIQILLVLITIGAFFGATNERLKKIEIEIAKFRDFLIASARLDERLLNLNSVVLAQGRRVDRLYERIYKDIVYDEDERTS